MSYDLMVFDKASAPPTRPEFMKWYDEQTQWAEEHSYDDPAVSSNELRNWFHEMIKTFPALNGPYSTDEESPRMTDYCIGKDVIYVAFSWSMAEQACAAMLELARKHGVGFFDVSSDNGDILIPVNGQLESLEDINEKTGTTQKRNGGWWKFW